jgi:excisionase family DNA binding protein
MIEARYLSVREAATYLSMTEKALYQRVYRRDVPVIKRGKLLRFDVRRLDGWMKGGAIDVAPVAGASSPVQPLRSSR